MVVTTTNAHGPRPAPRHVYSYVAHPQLYSDHYPEHENTPDGVISIAFSRSTIRSVHTNNDSVRGVVLVKSNIKIKSVSIEFIGRSTCRTFEGASQHISSTDLFRHEMSLQRVSMPSENCPKNRVEYAFEFRFPEAVQLPPSTPCPLDPKFESGPGHALPPSLWWDESTVRNEYVLEAQFVSEERHFTMNPKVVHQLRFFPSVPELGLPTQVPLKPAPPVRIERKARLDLSESGKGRLRRLSRRLSSPTTDVKESSSSSTSLLILSVPEHYRAGASSALKISLQTPPTEPTATAATPAPAPVYLRGIRAQAIARIDYRIPLPSHPSLAYNILRSGDSKFDLFNRRYAIPGLPLSSSNSGSSSSASTTDIEPFDINRVVPPTFRTYNVALAYDVRYDILLSWGGKESEHEVLVRDVCVEAMSRPGGWLGPPPEDGAHEERMVEEELLRGRGGVGVEPPAYEP